MIQIIRTYILPASLSLLPDRMDSPEARRMLLAIGLQESRFKYRRQIGGPARGFLQFERNGVIGVMTHAATKEHLHEAIVALAYEDALAGDSRRLHEIIEHNDVLACVLARLLLWTLPQPLPMTQEEAWSQYLDAWRPGRPHPETWAECWRIAGEE